MFQRVDRAPPDANAGGVADSIRECRSPGAPGDPDCQDCNENGFPDSCDIAAGISLDENENGIPDECEGEGMMGGGRLQGEGLFGGEGLTGGTPVPQGPPFFGDPEAYRAAWAEYYDWLREQDWGPSSELTGAEQSQRMVDKLRELGLPVRTPRL